MVNQKLVTFIKTVAFILGAIVLVVMGYLVGDGVRGKQQQQAITQTQESISQQSSSNTAQNGEGITQQGVKDFLIAYYTRKELSENRNRFKPFMTEGLYQAIVNEEEKPVNQAYKGYVVDEVFTDANIYIDSVKNEVLVTVKYNQVYLAKKNNYEQSTVKNNTDTIKLTYVKNNGNWLINQMEKMSLVKATNQTNMLGVQAKVEDEYGLTPENTANATETISSTTQETTTGE